MIFKNRKNSKFRLTASLPGHIYKPRHQMKHCTVKILRHNNKLTSEMSLLGFQWVWGLWASLFLLYSNRLFFLLHAAKPYQCVNFSNQHFPLAVYLDATTSILKYLCYSRGTGQVHMRYFECKISVLKWVWQDRYIRSLVDGSHFVLQYLASLWQMQWNDCLLILSWGLADLHDSSWGWLTPNTTVTLIYSRTVAQHSLHSYML